MRKNHPGGICRCDFHPTRRGLLGLTLGAAGASLLSIPALAKDVTALAITCIDYRLVDDTVRFFHTRQLFRDYDQVSLAGAALAGVSPKFPSSNAAFWDHVGIAKQLHNIRKLIVVDHRDCGAYKVAFGEEFQGAGEAETIQHKNVMEQVRAKLAQLHPDLSYEAYLMAVDGQTERLV